MGSEPAAVLERVLAVPEETWRLAVCRAEVIARLAAMGTVGLDDADAAAAELGVSRRLVYVLLGRWRVGEGVVSDLIPGKSSGGRGRERLPDEVEAVIGDVVRRRYLTRQKRSVAVGVPGDRAGVPQPWAAGALARERWCGGSRRLDPVGRSAAREGPRRRPAVAVGRR